MFLCLALEHHDELCPMAFGAPHIILAELCTEDLDYCLTAPGHMGFSQDVHQCLQHDF